MTLTWCVRRGFKVSKYYIWRLSLIVLDSRVNTEGYDAMRAISYRFPYRRDPEGYIRARHRVKGAPPMQNAPIRA